MKSLAHEYSPPTTPILHVVVLAIQPGTVGVCRTCPLTTVRRSTAWGVVPAATGRPAYHPAVLLKVYVYGYLNHLQSSRRLEREAQRNVELMWLIGRLAPDFKTIADFRKDNGEAIRRVCRQFVELSRQLGLLGEAVVAIDGSKFKAVNNRDKNFTPRKLKARVQQLEESIARYLSDLDRADSDPASLPAARVSQLKEKIAAVKAHIRKLGKIERQMLRAADQQVSLTDPDARSMATSGRGTGIVGYNVQTAGSTLAFSRRRGAKRRGNRKPRLRRSAARRCWAGLTLGTPNQQVSPARVPHTLASDFPTGRGQCIRRNTRRDHKESPHSPKYHAPACTSVPTPPLGKAAAWLTESMDDGSFSTMSKDSQGKLPQVSGLTASFGRATNAYQT
jgi:transposase